VGWTLSEDTVIGEIEDGANYYVEVDDERVKVIVAERGDRKYLPTDPDKAEEDSLLSLSQLLVRGLAFERSQAAVPTRSGALAPPSSWNR
jgi:hypothetical protein